MRVARGNRCVEGFPVQHVDAIERRHDQQIGLLAMRSAGGAAADGQAAIFTFGADTYVFISEGTDGVGAGDALIKLVGVTGLSDTTVNADNNLVIA